MFQDLVQYFAGDSFVYYLDISFDETVKRHTTRDKSALFIAEEMKEWYFMAEPLGIANEHAIPEHMPEADVIQLMRDETQL